MKILGYEIKKEQKDYVANIATPNIQGLMDVGKELQINLQIFYKMYRIDADIRRCIQEIQQTSGKSGWGIKKYINNRNDYKTLEIPEVSSILGGSKFRNLKNEIIQQLSISGTVFIKMDLNIEDNPNGFQVFDTRYMTVVTDGNLNPTRYVYFDKTKRQSLEFAPEDIYAYKDITDMDNPVFGISMLESLVYDVMGDLESSKSNYYFFQNDALPSSLYVLQEGLSAEAQEQIMTTLKTQLSGGSNKHKNIVSGNIVDIKPIQRNHTDMEFLNQKKFKTEKVCATLGVPKIILNYTDGVNYSTSEVQYQKFIENTIRPTEQALEIIFNDMLKKYLNGAEFYIIDKHINDFKDKLTLGIQAVQNGILTRNEARRFMGEETVSGDEMMDEYTVSSSTILLDSVSGEPVTVEQLPNEPIAE